MFRALLEFAQDFLGQGMTLQNVLLAVFAYLLWRFVRAYEARGK